VKCIQDALDAAAVPLNQALDAADLFDAAADQQLPSERLSAQVDTLHEVASGVQPDEAKLKSLWAAGVRYSALFKLGEDAASAANQRKSMTQSARL
jgi:hypothetical protein